jgi:hypothetical protein
MESLLRESQYFWRKFRQKPQIPNFCEVSQEGRNSFTREVGRLYGVDLDVLWRHLSLFSYLWASQNKMRTPRRRVTSGFLTRVDVRFWQNRTSITAGRGDRSVEIVLEILYNCKAEFAKRLSLWFHSTECHKSLEWPLCAKIRSHRHHHATCNQKPANRPKATAYETFHQS